MRNMIIHVPPVALIVKGVALHGKNFYVIASAILVRNKNSTEGCAVRELDRNLMEYSQPSYLRSPRSARTFNRIADILCRELITQYRE